MFKPATRYRPIEAKTTTPVRTHHGRMIAYSRRFGFGGVDYMRPATYSYNGPARGRRMQRIEQGRRAWTARRNVWQFGPRNHDAYARSFADPKLACWTQWFIDCWEDLADDQVRIRRNFERGLTTMHQYIRERTMGQMVDLARSVRA